MGDGLVTIITTQDKQDAYGADPDRLALYCIVNKYDGDEAEAIKGGTFRESINKFIKPQGGSGITTEQLGVADKVRNFIRDDESDRYLSNPQTNEQLNLMKLYCYRKAGDVSTKINSPRTGGNFACQGESIKDFLSTIDIDGKTYDHLDIVVEFTALVGRC